MSRSFSRCVRTALICGLVVSGSMVGCSRTDRVQTTLAEGTVLGQDGKPLDRATVVFHPTETSLKFPKPRGTTNAEGRFQLSTYDTNDGAPAGKYKVTIEQWYRDTPDQAPTNHLPAGLASEATSGIDVQLSKDKSVLEPFKIR